MQTGTVDGGDEKTTSRCRGHEERSELVALMAQERPVKEMKKGKINVKLPNQAKPKRMFQDELREAFRKTREWEKIEEGATYTVPTFIFLKQAPNTKKKPAANSRRIVDTKSRQEKKLHEMKDEMLKAGMTLQEAEEKVLKDK